MDDSRFEVFRGYICQDLSATEEKNEDDDEDEQDQDWDDQEEDAIAAGALHVQPKKPPYRKVKIRSLENRKTIQVHGHFLSIDPWWEVTVSLKPKESRGTLRHYGKHGTIREMRCQPSYRVRNDKWLDEGGIYGSVIYQFLTDCKVPDESKDYFMKYVRGQVPKKEHITLETIFTALEDCEVIEDEKTRELLCMVKPYITQSECGLMVKQAMENPYLFQLLPRLLPDRTLTLLKQCAGGDNKWKLDRIEAALKDKPWVLGFSVALRKETNVVLTEVSVDRFNQAGILQDMEQHIQDGLHVYYVLKRKCWSEGHTYLWEKGLKHQLNRCYPGYKVQDWPKMWTFLQEVDAVHRKEPKGKWAKIFLYRYYKAEDKIVKALAKILERGDEELSCLKEHFEFDHQIDKVEPEDAMEKDMEKEKEMPDSGVSSKDSQTSEELPPKCEQMDTCVTKEASISVAVSDDELIRFLEEEDNDMPKETCQRSAPEESSCQSAAPTERSCQSSAPEERSCQSSAPEEMSCQSSAPEDGLFSGDDDDDEPKTSRYSLQEQNQRDQEHFKDDVSQRKAARSIRDNPFTIISGKGGCGKTHVVLKVLEEFPSHAVAMAAPTGKAASNLRKRSENGIESFTLHQISWQYTNFLKKKREYEQAKKLDSDVQEPKFYFESTEILVVDECSMVPITVFSNVLFALLYQGRLKKLVLLGDYRQLPSVEPGNLLSDLYRVFKQYGWSIELAINHRAESELIVKNATEISNQRMPIFDSDRFQMMELPENNGYNDVNFLHNVVKNLYETEESIKDHKRSQFVAFKRADCSLINDWCCPLYSGHACVDPDGKFIFRTGDKICPSRNALVADFTPQDKEFNSSKSVLDADADHDVAGSSFMSCEQAATQIMSNDEIKVKPPPKPKPKTTPKNLNQDTDEAAEIAFLEQLCSQHPISPAPGGGDSSAPGGGDKEMDGSMNKSKDEEKKANNEKRICNGEIYFITHVNEIQERGKKKDEQISMTDNSEGDPGIIAPLKDLKLKASVRHAWARTIHTYQGSESETVIYLLGNSGAQNWQHVYTAITRGKAKVYIIGTKSNLKSAIKRDARVRNTELKEMLMEKIIPKLKQMQEEQNGIMGSQKNCIMGSQMQTRSQNANATQMDTSQFFNSTCVKGGKSVPSVYNSTQVRDSKSHQVPNSKHQTYQRAQTCQSSQPQRTSTQIKPSRPSDNPRPLYHGGAVPESFQPQMTSTQNNPAPSHFNPKNSTLQSDRIPESFQPQMTSTQMDPSQRNENFQTHGGRTFQHFQPQVTSTQPKQSNFTEWRQKPPCSPVKSFTSVKDLPGTSQSATGLSHSTPKQSQTSFQADNPDDEEWSNEWSDDRFQQILDMENTIMMGGDAEKATSTPPRFDSESDKVDQTTKSTVNLYQPKPLFKSTTNEHSNAKVFKKFEKNKSGQVNNATKVFRKFKPNNVPLSSKNAIPTKCNKVNNAPPKSAMNPAGQGFKSPPPMDKTPNPMLAMSPFSPNTSGRFHEALTIDRTPRRNAKPKRLYTDMKESPITDGFPSKKHNLDLDLSSDTDMFL